MSERNEPLLQRAVLDLLLEVSPKRLRFDQLAQYEQLRGCDRRALINAIRSLHIACLVNVDEMGWLVPSPVAEHFHWLMTQGEAASA